MITCERCGYEFKNTTNLQRHKNRKVKCKEIKTSNNESLCTTHKLGQFFTSNEYLKKCVLDLILNNPETILEPSMGRGDLVDYVLKNKSGIKFDLYEIDNSIHMLGSIDKNQVIFGDFLDINICKKYDTIIGNPPYVKTKNGNLYLNFIKKCYELLDHNGEIIFIVPSDFIKLTSSGKLINEMLENGTFTHMIHPNDENLFSNASIDVIVFRYCKNKDLDKKVLLNNTEKYLINTNGILTFTDKQIQDSVKIEDYFEIFVGMVTGKEEVFKNDELGNIQLLNNKDKIENYILINKFPTGNKRLDKYMLSHKDILIDRKIKKFNENNWFEWGAMRNYDSVKNRLGDPCIYICTMTRNKEVAFTDTVKFFGGSLLVLIPKKDCKIDLQKFTDYLNSDLFKDNYMYSGRFKIGHKQLSNSLFQLANFL